MNNVVEGKPGSNALAASSATISGSEHNRYQRFLGICGEDPVVLFNVDEEEEFDKDDYGFAFNFYIVGNISIVNVVDKCTLRS